MATQLNDISILVNNDVVAYTADSLTWKDGFGDYAIRNAIVGGGQTEQVFSKDLASKFGNVKFDIPTTAANVALAREWKDNNNNNVVELIGPSNVSPQFTRIFTLAAILEDFEAAAATDGNITIDFSSNPAQ